MHARSPYANSNDNDADTGPAWTAKTRAKHRAEELSQWEVGDISAADEYLAQAEGQVKWEDLVAHLTKLGWRLVEIYPYHNQTKTVLYESVRFQYLPFPSKKMFVLRYTTAEGRIVCKAGPVRVPYNLPDVLARKGEPLILVEGEAGANRCKAAGLRVTCVQGQIWTEDVAQFFEGEDVIPCMDNDEAGRKSTARALDWLVKVKAKVRVPDLPDLGPRKGLDDWLETHTVDELKAICEATPPEPGPAHLKLHNPADWEGKPLLNRIWVVDPLVPEKNVALLYGDGGLGKSLLAVQLAVARACSGKWLNLPTLAGRTLVLSAEDDADEMHRRMAAIALHYNVPLGALGGIRLLDLVGQDAVIGELARNGKVVATELYHYMMKLVARFKPGLVIVDALADSFAGDENNRTQARQFISMLRRPARAHDCAFVAVAHPSLSGISSGRGTSGSTGWNNSVRSRMYFETVEHEGTEPDPNLKLLRQHKANYSAAGFELLVRYENGLYVPVTTGVPLDRMAKAAQAEDVFLRCLTRLNAQGRPVSDKSGANYAPNVISEEREATECLCSKVQLKAAMLRLLESERITVVVNGPASRQRRQIVVATTL